MHNKIQLLDNMQTLSQHAFLRIII